MIEGEGAYSRFKYESGVHRVQRVPETESQGRVHTSTTTVAVLPEAEDVELEIDPKDLKIDTFRSSGAGGQHINKTSSAIRITHLPTGTVVECQDERSQYKNKDKALKVLKSRLLKEKQDKQASEIAANRKSQVGTGDRSERIRTYNYPQGRLTDHRIGLTLYKLEDILNGNLDEVIDALVTADRAEKNSKKVWKIHKQGDNMQTLLLDSTQENINKAGEILRNGGLVGMPTETVYGLAADALNGKAVAKIFKAKGRPMDNPLIVHIAEFGDIEKFGLVAEIPQKAKILAEKFMPGPLTIIMKKSEIIPDEVSAGLETVAIRCPSHPVARALIKAANTPLAAPSANISGSPSPTTATHVMNDMNGKIEAIIDGGASEVGVESTVITLAGEVPCLLRPGGITLEQLRDTIGEVELNKAVLDKLDPNQKAASPGMKYKHYSPKARVILLKGTDEEYINYVNSKDDGKTAALCCDEDIAQLKVKTFSLGKRQDYAQQAHRLFDMLREVDEVGGIDTAYSRLPSCDGVGMALYNRLIRAAGYEVIDLEKI